MRIFVNEPRRATRKESTLDKGQLHRLYEHKLKRGLIVNPPLKGKTVAIIRDGKYIKVEDE
jgi:hypothetical protein